MAGGVFVLLVLWFDQVRGRELWQRLVAYCKIAAPVYAFFLLLDRLYQFYRFGSFTNTYASLYAKQQRLLDPTLPVEGCSHGLGCRCYYEPVLTEIYP